MQTSSLTLTLANCCSQESIHADIQKGLISTKAYVRLQLEDLSASPQRVFDLALILASTEPTSAA